MLKQKVIIVIGATGGMGKSISKELSTHGATLCLIGRNKEKLEFLKKEISKDCKKIFCYTMDLLDDESIRKTTSSVLAHHKKINILIHAAGIVYSDEEISKNPILFNEQIQINTQSIPLVTSPILPYLTDKKSDIFFINSQAGVHEKKGYVEYSKSKSELKKYTDELRALINPRGIRVTTLYPGSTATRMQEKIKKESNMPYIPDNLIQPEDISHLIISLLTLPRTSEVTDLYVRTTIK